MNIETDSKETKDDPKQLTYQKLVSRIQENAK